MVMQTSARLSMTPKLAGSLNRFMAALHVEHFHPSMISLIFF